MRGRADVFFTVVERYQSSDKSLGSKQRPTCLAKRASYSVGVFRETRSSLLAGRSPLVRQRPAAGRRDRATRGARTASTSALASPPLRLFPPVCDVRRERTRSISKRRQRQRVHRRPVGAPPGERSGARAQTGSFAPAPVCPRGNASRASNVKTITKTKRRNEVIFLLQRTTGRPPPGSTPSFPASSDAFERPARLRVSPCQKKG